MAMVVYGGPEAFRALLYPHQDHPANQTYFLQNLQNFSDTLTEAGRTFMEQSKAIYDRLNSSEVMRIAQNALRQAGKLFLPNVIRPLYTLEDFQQAQPVMQRYIMSCPSVREAWQQQLCQGYGDTYLDLSPGGIRETDYTWRRVMDGIIVEDDEGWYVKSYLDELIEGDPVLTIDQKTDILSSWELADLFMQAAKGDLTDSNGGML